VESLYNGGCLNALKSIRQSISGSLRTVVFNNFFSGACVPVLQNLLLGSICRLSIDQSIPSQSACIVQTINLCTSEEERLLKVCTSQYLDNFFLLVKFRNANYYTCNQILT
jgi:hypothetical protein